MLKDFAQTEYGLKIVDLSYFQAASIMSRIACEDMRRGAGMDIFSHDSAPFIKAPILSEQTDLFRQIDNLEQNRFPHYVQASETLDFTICDRLPLAINNKILHAVYYRNGAPTIKNYYL